MADEKTLEARANAAQRLADALERVAAATNASAESQLESAKAATAAAKANQELQLSQEGNEAAIDVRLSNSEHYWHSGLDQCPCFQQRNDDRCDSFCFSNGDRDTGHNCWL